MNVQDVVFILMKIANVFGVQIVNNMVVVVVMNNMKIIKTKCGKKGRHDMGIKKKLVCAKCGADDCYEFRINDDNEIYCNNCLEVWGEAIAYE